MLWVTNICFIVWKLNKINNCTPSLADIFILIDFFVRKLNKTTKNLKQNSTNNIRNEYPMNRILRVNEALICSQFSLYNGPPPHLTNPYPKGQKHFLMNSSQNVTFKAAKQFSFMKMQWYFERYFHKVTNSL